MLWNLHTWIALGLATMHTCEADTVPAVPVRKHTYTEEVEPSGGISISDDGSASKSMVSATLAHRNTVMDTSYGIMGPTNKQAPSLVRKTHEHEPKHMEVDAKGNIEISADDKDKAIIFELGLEVNDQKRRIHDLEAALEDMIDQKKRILDLEVALEEAKTALTECDPTRLLQGLPQPNANNTKMTKDVGDDLRVEKLSELSSDPHRRVDHNEGSPASNFTGINKVHAWRTDDISERTVVSNDLDNALSRKGAPSPSAPTPAPSAVACAHNSDACLQSTAGWDTSHTCSGGIEWCSSWSRDMHRCCPDSCGVSPVCDRASCLGLIGLGSCNYPNAALSTPCSSTAPTGYCSVGYVCNQGVCEVPTSAPLASCPTDESNCIMSPNYPSNYSNSEGCEATFGSTLGIVVDFDTESFFDTLTVDSSSYSGAKGHAQHVAAGASIVWTADSSLNAKGWKICEASFSVGEAGVASCPTGYGPITTATKCVTASAFFGYTYDSAQNQNLGSANSVCHYCGGCQPPTSHINNLHEAAAKWICEPAACSLGSYWCDQLQSAGISVDDQHKLTIVGNTWLYDGANTKVGAGDHDALCESSMLFCAGGDTFGYGSEQAAAVKTAIDNGGVHPSAPAPTASPTAAAYTITAVNVSTCSNGYGIESSYACEQAALTLGFQFMGSSRFHMHPRGCAVDLDDKVTHNFILPPLGLPSPTEKLICASSNTCATFLCPDGQQHKPDSVTSHLENPTNDMCCEQKADGAECVETHMCQAELGDTLKKDKSYLCDCVFNHRGERDPIRCHEWLTCLHQKRSRVQTWFKTLLEFSTDNGALAINASLVQPSSTQSLVKSPKVSRDTCFDPSVTDVFSMDCACVQVLEETCAYSMDVQTCLKNHACASPQVCDSWKTDRCSTGSSQSLIEVRRGLESRAERLLGMVAEDTAEETLRSKC